MVTAADNKIILPLSAYHHHLIKSAKSKYLSLKKYNIAQRLS